MKKLLTCLCFLAATGVAANDTRELDAHEHGVGQLDIAFDGAIVAMEFHAPGADIVGFEYKANSAEDRAAVDAAVATLARPLDLFVLPQAAGCSVVQAGAALEGDDGHDHDHDHADEKVHSEFHATYTLNCAQPEALTEINFAYFDEFENALEVEVQVVTGAGAQAFEVVRDAPTLDLRSLF